MGITAYVTFLLWKATRILTDKIGDMAKVMSMPAVVLTISPGQLESGTLEVVLDNTGTATAFDIKIDIKPVYKDGRTIQFEFPFDRIRALRSKDEMRSFVNGGDTFEDCVFYVTMSWCAQPGSSTRTTQTYELDAKNLKNLRTPGENALKDVVRSLNNISNMFKPLVYA